jgi:hypothetical protein
MPSLRFTGTVAHLSLTGLDDPAAERGFSTAAAIHDTARIFACTPLACSLACGGAAEEDEPVSELASIASQRVTRLHTRCRPLRAHCGRILENDRHGRGCVALPAMVDDVRVSMLKWAMCVARFKVSNRLSITKGKGMHDCCFVTLLRGFCKQAAPALSSGSTRVDDNARSQAN